MNPIYPEIDRLAGKYQPQVVALRRRIHQYPELGNHLPRTREAVLEAIAGLDLEVHLSETTSGIVAILKGGKAGPVTLLRGDMDALPMPEDTGLEFSSEIDNRMHACGHDAHTAMLAGAAAVLCDCRDSLRGTVVFMFQPGEEGPGGAGPMLEEGILERGGIPDRAFALHVLPNAPSGQLLCRPGPILAAADTVSIRVNGKGGHGSMPWDALDPVPVACEMVQALQVFVTRRFNPFDPVVISVGRINAGTTYNVIPEKAEMVLTVRSFSDENRNKVHAGIRDLATGIAAAHGLKASLEIAMGYPCTINHKHSFTYVKQVLTGAFGDSRFIQAETPWPGAEDFSLVLQRYPGCFIFLGAAPTDGPGAPCHSNRMMLDEDAMKTGVSAYAALALG